MYRFSCFFFCLATLLFTASSCENKGLPPFSSNIEVNRWIEKEMKLWYYWEDKLPATPFYAQDPSSFFSSLLYRYDSGSRPDGDRFSWIQQSADELKSSLSGEIVTYGMEYRIVSIPSLNQVAGVILYVLPGSPADGAGLQRGDVFTHVNETALTSSNYRTLLAGTDEKKFSITIPDSEGNLPESSRTAALTPVRYQEDPVHFYDIKTIAGKKVAYLVYHQFYPSTNGTNDRRFDRKLEAVFAEFRSQQIDELIVDLRYNSGGYVSSAIHLGSLIASNLRRNDVFSIKEYNSVVTAALNKRYGDDFFVDRFIPLPQNIGDLIDRVYILTSGRTASASELLINGLLPYMEVITVGEITVGKNVGSVTLSDSETRTNWGLQPIVSKSYNSLGQSDYTSGFRPDYPAAEQLRLYPYGDERDPLLKAALEAITGTNGITSSDKRLAATAEINREFTELSVSFSKKTGENMFEDTIPAISLPE